MEAFTKFSGKTAILDKADVDTDQIIPKQFLKKIERTGFGKHLFHDWRYLDDDGKADNPDFILNEERYRNVSDLIVRDNFGCGSSREHAPWALLDYGFRVIIAPSFADIFYNNCFKNGILPVVLSSNTVQILFEYVEKNLNAELIIDLEKQSITIPSSDTYIFEVDSFRRECLLNGLDDIGLTMRYDEKIIEFEKKYSTERKFLFTGLEGNF